jgi:hypothetical protein
MGILAVWQTDCPSGSRAEDCADRGWRAVNTAAIGKLSPVSLNLGQEPDFRTRACQRVVEGRRFRNEYAQSPTTSQKSVLSSVRCLNGGDDGGLFLG